MVSIGNILRDIIFIFLLFWFRVFILIKQAISPFYRLIFAPSYPDVVQTPPRYFLGLDDFSFTSRYVTFPEGGNVTSPRVHFIQEGDGNEETVLLLHGEPTWSYLYRHMIADLKEKSFHVIALDFIGFGKSDKYTCPEAYTHQMHCATVRKLIDHLNLKNITLVCQDWGGLVGLTVVKQVPERFGRLVIMNTALPDGHLFNENYSYGNMLRSLRRMIPFLVWRSFVELFGMAVPLEFLFRALLKRKYPSFQCDGYLAPFPSEVYRAGAVAWPLMVPLFRDDAVATTMHDTRLFLRTWNKPALIMFSDQDPITRGQNRVFKEMIPHAEMRTIRGAGHFLQETHSEELCKNINDFVRRRDNPEEDQE